MMRLLIFVLVSIVWRFAIAESNLIYCSHRFGVDSRIWLKNQGLSVQVDRSDPRVKELLQCIRGPNRIRSGFGLSLNVANYQCRHYMNNIAEIDYSYLSANSELFFQCNYPGTTQCEQSSSNYHWEFDKIKVTRAAITLSYKCQQETESAEVEENEEEEEDESPITEESIPKPQPPPTKIAPKPQPPPTKTITPKPQPPPTKKIAPKPQPPPTKKIAPKPQPPPTKKIAPKPQPPPTKKSIPRVITTTTPTFLESLVTSESKRMAIFPEGHCVQPEGICLPISSAVFAIILALFAVLLAVLFFTLGCCVGRLYYSTHGNVPSSDAAHPASSTTSTGQEHDTVAATSRSQTHNKMTFISVLENLFKRGQKSATLRTAIANDINGEQQQQQQITTANEAQSNTDTQMQSSAATQTPSTAATQTQSNAATQTQMTTVTQSVTADEKKGNEDEDINTYSDVNILKESVALAPRGGAKLISTYVADASPTTNRPK